MIFKELKIGERFYFWRTLKDKSKSYGQAIKISYGSAKDQFDDEFCVNDTTIISLENLFDKAFLTN